GSGHVQAHNNGVFNNNTNGLFIIQNDSTWEMICCTPSTFNNNLNSTLRKPVGAVSPAQTLFTGVVFNDAGFTNITAGTFRVNDASGQYTKSGGTLGTDSGTVVSSPGTITIQAAGALSGSGTIVPGPGGVVNQGTTYPGGVSVVGTMTITGDYYQLATGV